MRCSWCQQIFARELSLLEILWPLRIPSSEKCATCSDKFLPVDSASCCKTCCQPSQECRDCLYWQQRYPDFQLIHRALMVYNQGMQEWLHQYKRIGDYRLRETFASEIKQAFQEMAYDVVIPIPLSQKRYQQRGFNQVEGLLQAAGVTYRPWLKKNRHLPPQAGLTREERLAVPQPFVFNGQEEIKGKRILLVDDVYTTGQTLHHAAAALFAYQPSRIASFSLVR
jgi:competence protein ComFC